MKEIWQPGGTNPATLARARELRQEATEAETMLGLRFGYVLVGINFIDNIRSEDLSSISISPKHDLQLNSMEAYTNQKNNRKQTARVKE